MVTQGSPAQGGEEVVAYAVGLGLTTPAVKTGQAATAATPTYETFYLDFNFRPNSLATKPILPAGFGPTLPIPQYTGLVPGYAGLYQINLIVPPAPVGTQACSGNVLSNLTVNVGGLVSFDGAGLCVALQSRTWGSGADEGVRPTGDRLQKVLSSASMRSISSGAM